MIERNMNEKKEAVFINKCSSMSSNELSEYIEMCFSFLENPQKHLADLQKIPVLRKTYDVLIENLETKLMELEKLVFCKNKLNELKKLELGKTIDTNFINLEQYYKAIELDKNSIVSEVAQTKHAVEEILTILLQSLFSEVRTASIFVKSSEPYYKVLEMLYDLSTKNKEVEQIISLYKFKDFKNLFFSNFQYENAEDYISDLFFYSCPSFNLVAFAQSFWNSVVEIIWQSYFSRGFSQSKINRIEKELKSLEKFWLKSTLRFDIGKLKLENVFWSNDYYKESGGDRRKKNIESVFTEKLQEYEDVGEKISDEFDHLYAIFEDNPSLTLKNNNLKLNDEIIKRICSEKNWQKRLDRLLDVEKEWLNLRKEKNTINPQIVRGKFDKYIFERNKYADNFVNTFNSLIKDTISQIDNEIKKFSQNEKTNSYLQSSKESLTNLQSTKEKIFADSKQMIVKEIFWDLLPQGEWKTEGLIKTFNSYGWSKDEFDETRLRQIIESLNPSICYIGKEKFQGYVVFGFDWTKKVVLECPKYGNAIYIIEDDWQEITKLSKWEARKLNEVTVIRHNETWFSRLKSNLKNAY